MSENVFNGKWDKSFFYDTYEIPIQKLSRINFTKDDKVTRIFFKIKSNESVITQTIESSLPSSEKDTVSVAILYIPNNLLADNLPERLTKAFDNLISLCGGKITKEVF